jgi:hypothetical protein
MPTDIEIYCHNMAVVRDRINKVQTMMAGQMGTGDKDLDAELIFLQFRKVIEGIVYSLLSANKTAYAAQNAKFANHWRAKDMLAEMETINPKFFPIPLLEPLVHSPGFKHFERVPDGFLTRDDMVILYDGSSGVLHTRNPYSTKPQMINVRYTVQEWVSRFQKLLSLHVVQLVNGDAWLTNIPGTGPVHSYLCAALPFVEPVSV